MGNKENMIKHTVFNYQRITTKIAVLLVENMLKVTVKSRVTSSLRYR